MSNHAGTSGDEMTRRVGEAAGRLKAVQMELASLMFVKSQRLHLGSAEDEKQEAKGVAQGLREIVSTLRDEIEELAFERDGWEERLSVSTDENYAGRLRSAITIMYGVVCRARRRAIISKIASGVDSMNLEIKKQEQKRVELVT